MPIYNITSFTGGELSPLLNSRVDFDRYNRGLQEMRGFMPRPQGPSTRVPGTVYSRNITGSAKTLLLPFIRSREVAYLLEFSDLTCKVMDANGTAVQTLTTIWPSSALFLSNGEPAIMYTQGADVLYLYCKGYKDYRLERLTSITFQLVPVIRRNGPFNPIDITNTVGVYASGATGSVTLTAASATFAAGHVGSLFYLEPDVADTTAQWEPTKSVTAGSVRRSGLNIYKAANTGTTGSVKPTHTQGTRTDGDANVSWEYLHSGYGILEITAFTSSTQVTATVSGTLPALVVGSGNATTSWSFGTFNNVNGWPEFGVLWRNRLCIFAGTQFNASVAGDFEDYAERDAGVISNDMAISRNLATDNINEIRWVMPMDNLVVGGDGGESVILQGTTANPLGPENCEVVEKSGIGARKIRPVLSSSLFYIQSSGRKLREFTYSLERDTNVSIDRSILTEHLMRSGTIAMAYCREPDSIIYMLQQDGTVLGYTRDPDQEFSATFQCAINGTVESICSIPSSSGDRDVLWMVVNRTINGSTLRTIEYMAANWRKDGDDPCVYVDGAKIYTGPITTLTGLNHLEGQTIIFFADGGSHESRTVASGSVTLSRAYTTVIAGLRKTTRMKTLPLSFLASDGATTGKKIKISKIQMRLFETLGISIGETYARQMPIPFNRGLDIMGLPPDYFTGVIDYMAWNGTYEWAPEICLEKDDALPCTILGLSVNFEMASS